MRIWSAISIVLQVIDKKAKPVSEKVEAIVNFPKPKTIEELRRFLRMVNFYRRFLKRAAAAQAPLTELLKGAKKRDKRLINWTEQTDHSFILCKDSLANAALLAHPKLNSPLQLITDVACGAILQQEVNDL